MSSILQTAEVVENLSAKGKKRIEFLLVADEEIERNGHALAVQVGFHAGDMHFYRLFGVTYGWVRADVDNGGVSEWMSVEG